MPNPLEIDVLHLGAGPDVTRREGVEDTRLPVAAHALASGLELRGSAYTFRSGHTVDRLAAELVEGEKEPKPSRFKMSPALSPKPFQHPLWGKLVIDMSDLEFKPRIPILQGHEQTSIIGVGEPQASEKKGIEIDGEFSRATPEAVQVEQLAKEGFPWEASAAVPPGRIQFLEEGESATVNGDLFEGPGTIFRNVRLVEASFVAVGQDPNTSVSTFSASEADRRVLNQFSYQKETTTMAEPTTPPVVATPPAAPAPDPSDQSKVLQDERVRCKTIRESAFSGQEDLVLEALDGGWTIEKALLSFNAHRKAKEDADRAVALAASGNDTVPQLGPPAVETPAVAATKFSGGDFNPDEVPYDEAKFKAYWAAAPEAERKRYSHDEGSFLAYFKHALHKSEAARNREITFEI